MQTRRFNGKVNIYHLLEGAKQARGTAVIIDVLRAFSLECYLYSMGAGSIRPVGSIEEAFSMRDRFPGSLLAGERKGRKCDGFDYGNSPCSVDPESVRGKLVIHTTSAGTQGIVNAVHATEILAGSLVNAKATAEYLIRQQPEEVSLVCMGNGGVAPAVEDELCAEYLQSLLTGSEPPDMERRIRELPYTGAGHFFVPETQDVFPEQDFWLCTEYDKFDFALKVVQDEYGFLTLKIEIPEETD